MTRTYLECKEEALGFASLWSWSKGHSASYRKAYREGWQRKIAEELGWEVQEQRTRTYQECKEEALGFASLGSWKKGHSTSYQKAYREGWQRKIAEELGWEAKKKTRTYQSCKEEALGFASLWSWSKGHSASYQKALREGWQRKIAEELGWK